MTNEEALEVELRRTISVENKEELSKKDDKEATQKKFIDFMMIQEDGENTEEKVFERMVPGTHFSQNGVCEIN
jgi:hypothetical protein